MLKITTNPASEEIIDVVFTPNSLLDIPLTEEQEQLIILYSYYDEEE